MQAVWCVRVCDVCKPCVGVLCGYLCVVCVCSVCVVCVCGVCVCVCVCVCVGGDVHAVFVCGVCGEWV